MPRRRVVPPPLYVGLDPESGVPLYRQLYQEIRQGILNGRLRSGAPLPSSRLLAEQLGISRNTVNLALDQLAAEGYLDARPRGQTHVAAVLPDSGPLRPAPGPSSSRPERTHYGLSRRGAVVLSAAVQGLGEPASSPRPFRPGTPALDAFPLRIWRRLITRQWGRPPSLGYGDPAGYPPLRRAIAEYVAASRGARCRADQIIIVSGSQQGIDLAARVLLNPGDPVWMEDPGYPGARAALLAAEAKLISVPVDDGGLAVHEGERLAAEARLAYVSPSHQYPLGVTMTLSRRLALLDWAERAGSWIVEDDYDSEFRYAGRPLAAMQGLDESGRVIYVGTFSKTLFPALRLGYLIVPPELVEGFRRARAASDRHAPTVDQAVLAEFLDEGHFGRHLRRMRLLYAERQEALVESARRLLAGALEVAPSPAGMHLVGWLDEGADAELISQRAAAQGIEAPALSRYAASERVRPGLVLGYAGYSPPAIRRAMEGLAKALRAEAL